MQKKSIEGYEGIYEGHSNGLIWSFISDRYLSGKAGTRGYCLNVLVNNGVKSPVSVHRLIATLFIPNPESKPYINHKNGIKNDNRVENLEWCTQQENVSHAFKNGLIVIPKGEKNWMHGRLGKDSTKGKPVIQKEFKTGKVVSRYGSARQAAIKNGYSSSSITACCRGKAPKAYGYEWQYI